MSNFRTSEIFSMVPNNFQDQDQKIKPEYRENTCLLDCQIDKDPLHHAKTETFCGRYRTRPRKNMISGINRKIISEKKPKKGWSLPLKSFPFAVSLS